MKHACLRCQSVALPASIFPTNGARIMTPMGVTIIVQRVYESRTFAGGLFREWRMHCFVVSA